MPEPKEQDKMPVTPTDLDGPTSSEGAVIGMSLATETPAEKVKPKPAEKPLEKPAWDQERQYKEEIRSAQKREVDLRRKVEQAEQKAAQFQEQFKEIEAKKARGEDYDFEKFEDVAQAVKDIMQDIVGLRSDLRQNAETLQTKLEEVGSKSDEAQQTALKEAGMRALDEACKPLDAEYGAKHRNEAISRVYAKFDRLQIGKLPAVAQREWALETLEATYKNLSDADKTVKDDSVAADPILDTSSGGSPIQTKSVKIQEGTLDAVVEQYQQAHSGKRR